MKLEKKYYLFQLFFNLLLWIPIFYEFQKLNGLTDVQIFNIQSIYYLAFIVFELPTGFFADFVGKKKSLVLGAGLLAFANILPLIKVTFILFLAHFVLIALARSLISGTASALLYDSLKVRGISNQFKEIEGKARSMALIARLLTWPIASFFFKISPTSPYLVTFLFCLVALFVSITLPIDKTNVQKESAKSEMISSFKYIFQAKDVLVFMVQGTGLFILQRVCMLQLFQPLLKQNNIDVAMFGMVMSVMTAAEALCSAQSNKLSRFLPNDRLSLPILTIVLAMAFILLGKTNGYYTVTLLITFSGFCGLIFPIQKQLLNDSIQRDHQRSTILSIESIIQRSIASIFTFSIGYFISKGSLDRLFQWTGVAIISIILMTIIVTKLKKRQSECHVS